MSSENKPPARVAGRRKTAAPEAPPVADLAKSRSSRDDEFADSDEFSRRFRLKPATDSDRSQPGIPMIPAGVVVRVASGVN